jgi:hypothetical protein
MQDGTLDPVVPTPNIGAGIYDIRVNATDDGGLSTSGVIRLAVDADRGRRSTARLASTATTR